MIEFESDLSKITTLADRGYRVTLDLPETATEAISQLLPLLRHVVKVHLEVSNEER